MAKDVYIQVFVTKSRNFRAKITPKDKDLGYPYEVTVNGEQWHQGKGLEFREEILSKCQSMLVKLQHELKEAKYGKEQV